MIRRLIILLLIVGCDNSTSPEPEDCADVWGGTAVVDDCGVCDGIDGYVAGTCYDCADTPNGDAVEDNCGTCDGDGTIAGDGYVLLWNMCYNIAETNTLSLNNNNLTGGIPSEIGNLTNLTYLYLYNNQLTGGIPSEIGNLTNLTQLGLSYNQLSGEIPQQVCDLIENNNIPSYMYLNGNNLINTCD